MKTIRFILLGCLCAVLILPGVASAYFQLSYISTSRFNETDRTTAEMVCRKKHGLSRTQTGTLLYQVRRCIRNFEQRREQEEEGKSRRHRVRLQKPMQRETGLLLQNKTDRYRERLIEQKRRSFIQQSQDVEQPTGYVRSVRSNARQAVRERERAIRKQREDRLETRKKANTLCESYTGTQRVMCIRNKIREAQRQ